MPWQKTKSSRNWLSDTPDLVIYMARKGTPTTVNSPRRIKKGEPGHGTKKFVVRAKKGDTEKTIRYGDANMKIRKSNPKARKSFRARHGCDKLDEDDKLMAKYWSCKKW
tara:strand:- start:5221 stop:5547 length:327 start_codon:yes stop_codon:yes gene_type:complete